MRTQENETVLIDDVEKVFKKDSYLGGATYDV